MFAFRNFYTIEIAQNNVFGFKSYSSACVIVQSA